MFRREELHLEGSDAIDVSVSPNTHPITVIHIAHETMSLQNVHAHFGFCISKGQKASGRAQPTSTSPFSAKA